MSNKCPDSKYDRMLYAYELGLLTGTDREGLERHLLDCEHCFEKASRFADAAELLRESPRVRAVMDQQAGEQPAVEPKAGGRKWFPIRISLAAAALLMILLLKPWQLEFRPDLVAVAAENRLAVLPFEYLGETDSGLHLGEMVAELIITDLSESSYLQVVSSQRMSDTRKLLERDQPGATIGEIGTEIATRVDARWMVTGRIRQSADSWIVNSQLVELSSGLVLASQNARGESREQIFAMADSLSAEVKRGLELPSNAWQEADPSVADLTTESFEAYHYYLEGVRQAARYYTVEAVAALNKALEYDSTFAMAYYRLSFLTDRDLIYRAAEYASEASQREQMYIEAATANIEHRDSAHVATLRQLLQRYPDEKNAHERLAVYYLGMKQYDSTVMHLNRAIAVDSLNKTAYNLLAYTYDETGDHIRSVGAINQYISLAPDEANPYDTRGDLYARNGDLEGAIESYRLALDKKHDFLASRAKLISMLVFNADFEAAKTEIGIMLADSLPERRYAGRLYQTRSLIYQGRFDDALNYIKSARRQTRLDMEAVGGEDLKTGLLILKSQVLAARGEYEAAAGIVNEAIEVIAPHVDDDNVTYRYILAEYLAEAGQTEESEKIVADLRDNYARTDRAPCYRLWASGVGSLSLSQSEAAIDSLTAATDMTTIRSDFYGNYHLARGYLAADRVAEAIDLLEKLQRSYTETRFSEPVASARMIHLLGTAYEEARWYDRARDQYRHFLHIWRNADSDIALLEDARGRLAQLESGS